MKRRQSVSAAALVAAALLLLTGCFPPGLLPQRPEPAPMPETTFAPDDWVDDEDFGDDWVDDEDIVPDGVVDENDLYSWVSSSESTP